MKAVIALSICLVSAGSLAAQTPSNINPEGPSVSFGSDRLRSASYGPGFSEIETSGQKLARLRKAIALRSEAASLQEADGGTLTRHHLSYIQKKADAIFVN